MNSILYIVFLCSLYLIAYLKLFITQHHLMVILLFGIHLAVIMLHRKEIKLLPFSLSTLSFKKTSYLIVLQVLFLAVIITTVQETSQIISVIGMFVCEVVRLRKLPLEVKGQYELQQLSKKLEEMNQHFLTVRSQRHDFLKHVSALDFLIEHDKNHKAKEYFRTLLGEYDGVNQVIKGEDAHISSILLKYKQLAEQAGTDIEYKFNVPVSSLPMESVYQVQLITNLLENAVEASQSYHAIYNHSSVTFKTESHGGIYILEIMNHAIFTNKNEIDDLFEKFGTTSKGKGHQGLGTFIISNLVKSHNGRLSIQYIENTINIKIKIPLIVKG
ncbi:sensor histidine kinase [Metabacillus sp. YM-086]|uniref:sensor histidine kinase n=1 Tax=Metabacillus TaxID=2675233 RepID=UPI000EF576E9|nr:GHKL domain-containing protein [Metabacillus litoralis]